MFARVKACVGVGWVGLKVKGGPATGTGSLFDTSDTKGALIISILQEPVPPPPDDRTAHSPTPTTDYWGVFQNFGPIWGVPENKDYSTWGSLLGSPYFGKSPFLCESNGRCSIRALYCAAPLLSVGSGSE